MILRKPGKVPRKGIDYSVSFMGLCGIVTKTNPFPIMLSYGHSSSSLRSICAISCRVTNLHGDILPTLFFEEEWGDNRIQSCHESWVIKRLQADFKNWNSWIWLTFKPSFPEGHTAHRLLCLISIFPTLTIVTALCCHGVGQFAEPRLVVWTLSWAYFWGTFHWKLESSHGKVWNNYQFTRVIWRRSSARVEIGRVESN